MLVDCNSVDPDERIIPRLWSLEVRSVADIKGDVVTLGQLMKPTPLHIHAEGFHMQILKAFLKAQIHPARPHSTDCPAGYQFVRDRSVDQSCAQSESFKTSL